jgi:hypothetical protein
MVFLLAFPSEGVPWGALKEYAETHQYILREAMKLAASDPAFVQKFPSAEELVNHDYVLVTALGKSGPGPDVDGASPYSWHYYNPRTEKGLAPKKVADFFSVMMHKRVRGESQAREAAWAAHFLADMFVPYHVTGMPEEEAWQSFMAGTPLGEKETGPAELYSMKSPPPAGWGEGGDFSSALELFFNEYPPENDEGVDWFDPWYFNGWGGATAPGIATGSHGFWEYQAWEWFRVKQVVKKTCPPPGTTRCGKTGNPKWEPFSGEPRLPLRQNTLPHARHEPGKTSRPFCPVRTRGYRMPSVPCIPFTGLP